MRESLYKCYKMKRCGGDVVERREGEVESSGGYRGRREGREGEREGRREKEKRREVEKEEYEFDRDNKNWFMAHSPGLGNKMYGARCVV